jgi:hypothetical protein
MIQYQIQMNYVNKHKLGVLQEVVDVLMKQLNVHNTLEHKQNVVNLKVRMVLNHVGIQVQQHHLQHVLIEFVLII